MQVDSIQDALDRYSDYEDGEVIFAEGSTGTEIYFIVYGTIEISCRSGVGLYLKKTMATLEKGEYFGEMASLVDDVRSMTATAIGPVRLYQMTQDEMLQYMHNDPEIMKDIFVRLAQRLSNTNIEARKSPTVSLKHHYHHRTGLANGKKR